MANKKTTKKKTSASKKGKSTATRKNSKYVGKNKDYSMSFSERYHNAIMLVYILGGIFLGCVAVIPGFNIWEKLRGVLFSAFGLSFYLLVVQTVVIGVRMALGNLKRSFLVTNISGFLSVAAFSSVIHLFTNSIGEGSFIEWKEQLFDVARNGWNMGTGSFNFTGGILGGLFGGTALYTCGKAAAFVIVITVFLVSLFFYLNIDTNSFGDTVSATINGGKAKYDSSKENLKVKREERAILRNEKKEQRRAELEAQAAARTAEALNEAESKAESKPLPESFDFNETEIEYDPIDRETGKPLRPIKPFRPKEQIFTYGDGESPAPVREEEKFEIDFISSHTRSAVRPVASAPAVKTPPVKAEKDIPLSEADEETIDRIVPDDDTLSADASEIVQDAIKTANANMKKNMADVSASSQEKKRKKKEYVLPPIECLNEPVFNKDEDFAAEMRITAKKLVDVLKSFGVETTLIGVSRGPSVTRYELSPAPGVKISKITNLADDIALGLASSGVRIEAPIPNKSAVGIEVPNKTRATVTLREIISSTEYKKNKGKLLTVALGKDITGNVSCADLSKMPHLLIAGTTGSGKSVCLNGMIASILYNATPSEVKLLMIDPKQVEFTVYNGIPHLLVPVISDARKAAGSLAWAVSEMDNRYKTFAQCGVRDIGSFNKYIADHPELSYMPQIVIFIDELNDLMMVSPKEVEDSICRLAQKARAAGMHLVVATQRPSVDVITGIIKANIPSRLSLSVSSQVDSRTVLDAIGAEKLLGNGDMLFNPVGVSKPVRIQGAYLSDAEIEKIVSFIKEQENAEYDNEIMEEIERNAVAEKKKGSSAGGASVEDSDGQYDDMLDEAVNVITELNSASTTVLQRKLRVGYARAARIMDELEQLGYVSAAEGNNKPRKVLVTRSQYLEMKAGADVSNEDFDILSD